MATLRKHAQLKRSTTKVRSKNQPPIPNPQSLILAPPKERMTLEEFLSLMDEDVWAEWEDGEVIVMAPASRLHQRISRFLLMLLAYWLEAHDAGEVLAAPFAMHLLKTRRVREPDLLVVLKENLYRLQKTHLQGPADLVVEILSEESALRDRGAKFAEYELEGVKEYWLIDPQEQRVDVFVLEGGKFQRQKPDRQGFYRSEVLKGFRLKPEWLWQEPLPKVTDALKAMRRKSQRKV